MKIALMVWVSLILAAAGWAVEPQPLAKSAGEVAWDAIPSDTPDEEQVRLAKEYLDKYPDDIPLLRSVQNVLNRKSDLAAEFWKERMDKNPTAANRYLYARKTGDAAVMKEQAEWIVANDPKNFWGDYLLAVAEMQKEEPDLKYIVGKFESALVKDPARPEGWMYGADAYEQMKDWDNALRMYQALLVVDPTDKSPNMSMMGIYAQKRDADKYFEMASAVLPSEPPLEVSLGMYDSEHVMTAADFSGRYTVLELFTYW